MIGSHDSCACIAKDKCLCCCWPWAQTQTISLHDQFQLGVRLFDLRYHLDDTVYYMSHTFSTSYTVEQALRELIACAVDAHEYIYIRMKRDSSSPALPAFGAMIQPILEPYVIEYDGSTLWQFIRNKPSDSKCVLLYCDNDTLRDDHVTYSWIFPEIFDVIATWDCGTVTDAVERIEQKAFKENGLPKAIFIDFSAWYPPEIAFDMVWSRVQDTVVGYLMRHEIECVMINCVDVSTVHTLSV